MRAQWYFGATFLAVVASLSAWELVGDSFAAGLVMGVLGTLIALGEGIAERIGDRR